MRLRRRHSVGGYTRQIASKAARHEIRAVFALCCKSDGLAVYGEGFGPRRRELLQAALFRVEDRYESKAGGRPHHPVVLMIHAARMLVERDLGWEC